MALPEPGERRLEPDEVPDSAPGATRRQVAWLDAEGYPTSDPRRVANLVIHYRTDDGTPVLTAYGAPNPGEHD